jgi:hypothetical protein
MMKVAYDGELDFSGVMFVMFHEYASIHSNSVEPG